MKIAELMKRWKSSQIQGQQKLTEIFLQLWGGDFNSSRVYLASIPHRGNQLWRNSISYKRQPCYDKRTSFLHPPSLVLGLPSSWILHLLNHTFVLMDSKSRYLCLGFTNILFHLWRHYNQNAFMCLQDNQNRQKFQGL